MKLWQGITKESSVQPFKSFLHWFFNFSTLKYTILDKKTAYFFRNSQFPEFDKFHDSDCTGSDFSWMRRTSFGFKSYLTEALQEVVYRRFSGGLRLDSSAFAITSAASILQTMNLQTSRKTDLGIERTRLFWRGQLSGEGNMVLVKEKVSSIYLIRSTFATCQVIKYWVTSARCNRNVSFCLAKIMFLSLQYF